MVYFDYSGTVEESVRKNNENFNLVAVRPFQQAIQTKSMVRW
ncbi:hypothetical protein ADIARSV_4034 [Arcticibacter svalbardensis MN12-7]|uniref:Uncharacterized protein n=1 Tax=Arcticibacter svalbardensis MN12-7 TaxID=1150600 RepID=R9GLP9_9SPHI|nr:hypothetical protein ADIARSV_4034 [Arcticibacter svalbardensis MN12-7]